MMKRKEKRDVVGLEEYVVGVMLLEMESIPPLQSNNTPSHPLRHPLRRTPAVAALSSFRHLWRCASIVLLVTVAALFTTNTLLQRVMKSIQSSMIVTPTTTTTSSSNYVTASILDQQQRGSTSPTTFPFRYRGPLLNDTTKAALAATWGQWQPLQDLKAPRRPPLPCSPFDHCDVPRSQFPPLAWQSDAQFLHEFVTQAQDLVTRAQEAILAEYGQSQYDLPNKTLTERSKKFQLHHLHLSDGEHPPDAKKVDVDNGGWTTPRSFQGLVRRLLHAIMTQDTFTFALGGHSVAAGHGNLFKQSYAMQFHRVLEPVFGRLGIRLHSYNFGKGGIGTTQDAMGLASLWGKEIDFCMWDSGMTEFKSAHYELFARQALIGGNRVPVLWNGFSDVLELFHNQADVDVGGPGTGLLGIPLTESKEQAAKLPYAVRFLKCARDRKDLCDDHKYHANCWVNRTDFTPPIKQGAEPGGKMTQHPGFRSTQLSGRVLAFTILWALQEALTQWKNAPNYELPDSAWHVTDHYQNIRTKLSKLTNTACFNETTIPTPRLCTTPMKGASEYTPRAHPEQNSIRSIMTDTTYIEPLPANLYFGPDVYNPFLEPPEDAVNYLAIVENAGPGIISSTTSRRQLLSSSNSLEEISPVSFNNNPLETSIAVHGRRLDGSSLTVGRGWSLILGRDDIPCNGTYDSECGRDPKSACMLYGHNDGKGGLVFDSFSGWLLMRLNEFKHGIIILKIETWQHKNHQGKWSPVLSSKLTEGWTEINNGMDDKKSGASAHRRRLAVDPSTVAEELCPEFKFEFAINGRIQSWSKEEFLAKRIFVQPVVETWTLLDDPSFTSGKEVSVELGIRMRGCQRINSFKLTHVYWS